MFRTVSKDLDLVCIPTDLYVDIAHVCVDSVSRLVTETILFCAEGFV